MRSRGLVVAGVLVVVAIIALVLMLGRGDDPPVAGRAAHVGSGARQVAPPVRPPSLPVDAGTGAVADLPAPAFVAASSPSAFGGRAAIAGRVVLETGEPVPLYGIVLSKSASRHYADQPIAVRDADGRFAFQKIVAGTWNVAIEGPGIPRRVVSDVQLVDDTVTDVGTIVVHHGLKITGRVLDGSARPIAGATVGLQLGGLVVFEIDGVPTNDPALSQHATTDASGHYVLRGIGSESHGWLEASRGDPAHALRHPIPSADATIDFVFDSTGGIDGEVEGLAHGMVSARLGTEHSAAVPIVDGKFTFDHLQPGEYTVNVFLTFAMAPRPIRVTVPVNERVTATIARPKTVVTLVATGACDDGIALYGSDEVPEWFGFTPQARLGYKSCRNGQAVIDGVAPGGYWLCSADKCMVIEIAESPARQAVVLDLKSIKTPP